MSRWKEVRKEEKNGSLEESKWAQSSLSAGVALPVCADLLLCEHRLCSVCVTQLPSQYYISLPHHPHTQWDSSQPSLHMPSTLPACKKQLYALTHVCVVFFSWALYLCGLRQASLLLLLILMLKNLFKSLNHPALYAVWTLTIMLFQTLSISLWKVFF